MDRTKLEAMLDEHQRDLGRMQAATLRIQGAITLLRQQIAELEQEGNEEEDERQSTE